jgi:hypothetical protein
VLGTCQVRQPGIHLQGRGLRHGGPSACHQASHNDQKHKGIGKLPGRAMLATLSGVNQIGDNILLHVVDSNSGRAFLVDTGTEVSLLPAVRSDRRTSGTGTIPPLVAANGSVIKLYSKRTLPLNLCGQRFEGEFIVANVRQAILGADFLRASGLLVDMAGERLIHAAAYAVVNAPAALCSTVNVAYAVHAVDPVYAKLLAEFPTLESVNFSTPTVAHGVKLSIDTGSTMPIRTPARRLNPEKYKVAKELFDDMLKLGIIRRPKSQWVSPLHVVSKADGEWRPCGDYRRLNGLTKTDS